MSVIFHGDKVVDERSRTGFEIRVKTYELLSKPFEETPIVINNKQVNASLDTLLDYRPLALRNERERAIFKLQDGICRGFRKYFQANNFTEINSPKIVNSGAEGGANIFKLDYFGTEAYLAQSPQLYKQIMTGVCMKSLRYSERKNITRHGILTNTRALTLKSDLLKVFMISLIPKSN